MIACKIVMWGGGGGGAVDVSCARPAANYRPDFGHVHRLRFGNEAVYGFRIFL